jgi:phosphohistidine phosphatase
MKVCLVHHADAVWPHVDPQRPLSERGHARADWLAEQVRAAGFAPAAIWHSGKLRARQTAEPFYRRCNPFADFKMVRGLNPDDPPSWMRDTLLAETRDVLLVGHMPHIAALLRELAPTSAEFPLHGLVALEFDNETIGWTELWRAQAP